MKTTFYQHHCLIRNRFLLSDLESDRLIQFQIPNGQSLDYRDHLTEKRKWVKKMADRYTHREEWSIIRFLGCSFFSVLTSKLLSCHWAHQKITYFLKLSQQRWKKSSTATLQKAGSFWTRIKMFVLMYNKAIQWMSPTFTI